MDGQSFFAAAKTADSCSSDFDLFDFSLGGDFSGYGGDSQFSGVSSDGSSALPAEPYEEDPLAGLAHNYPDPSLAALQPLVNATEGEPAAPHHDAGMAGPSQLLLAGFGTGFVDGIFNNAGSDAAPGPGSEYPGTHHIYGNTAYPNTPGPTIGNVITGYDYEFEVESYIRPSAVDRSYLAAPPHWYGSSLESHAESSTAIDTPTNTESIDSFALSQDVFTPSGPGSPSSLVSATNRVAIPRENRPDAPTPRTPSPDTLSCDECPTTVADRRSLSRHLWEKHGIRSEDSTTTHSGNYGCRCGKRIARKENHKRHLDKCKVTKRTKLSSYLCRCGRQDARVQEHLAHLDSGCGNKRSGRPPKKSVM